MNFSVKDIKAKLRDGDYQLNKTEEKANDVYDTIVSFFENRINKLENRFDDSRIVKKETSTTGIVLGTLAGLAIGAVAALRLPDSDIKLPKAKDLRRTGRETGKKVNSLYNNLSSFFDYKLHNVENRMEDAGLIEKRNTGPGIILGALAGLAIGGAAALLLAQDTGKDFRTKVQKNFNEKKDQLINKKEDILHFAKKETENVKNASKAQDKDFSNQEFINKDYTNRI